MAYSWHSWELHPGVCVPEADLGEAQVFLGGNSILPGLQTGTDKSVHSPIMNKLHFSPFSWNLLSLSPWFIGVTMGAFSFERLLGMPKPTPFELIVYNLAFLKR